MNTKKINPVALVLKTMRDYDMVSPGDTVLAAVSGGPDSVLLLRVLCSLKNKLKIREICVCNLDHGIRGNESAEDSRFVRSLACKLGLRFIHKTVKICSEGGRNLSTEERAREERYKFFKESARSVGANVVATGHTIDDQAETVLMRFISGSSMKGMAGIAPVRSLGKIRVIRPLIELEKKDVVGFLDREGVEYRVDSTNAQPVYFRNVVRGRIIPFLEKFNPRLKRAMFNLAEHMREDLEFVSAAKRAASGKIFGRQGGLAGVAIKDMVVQPKAIQKEILRDLLESSGGEIKRLSFRHWKQLEDLLVRKSKGNSVDLPGGIRARRTGARIVFGRI